MKAMSNGGGGKAARAEKKEAKKDLKETRQLINAVAPKGIKKAVKAVAKERMQATKAAAKPVAKAVGRSLSDLDKFDKKINVSKVSKEEKPGAKAFNKMIKNRK